VGAVCENIGLPVEKNVFMPNSCFARVAASCGNEVNINQLIRRVNTYSVDKKHPPF
jgi:hypothetical protein